MSTSVATATPPPRRPRPSGPRRQGPRQHVPSVARSTASPAPERVRLVRNSPVPIELTGHARVCLNSECPGSDIVEDDMGGGLVCRACGTILNESNIVAENTWIENPGGVPGMAGQFVGSNQAAPRPVTGMRARQHYGPGNEPSDSRFHSEQKARTTLQNLQTCGINPALVDQGIQIYKLAVQHGLLHGRTIELVAAVSAYVACRRNPQSNTVMLIDIAEQLDINLFVLGSLYQKMVDKLKGIGGSFNTKIDPVNPETLITRFADQMEFGSDKIKIIRDAVHIFKRMKRDWMTDGRRPAGIAAAAILLGARMNNYHRTVREMVLHAKLTEITINKRLWEFSNTEAAQWHVDEFRKLARQEAEGTSWEGDGPMGLPPRFYMDQANPPKRPRGRPRKHPRPEGETAAEIENGAERREGEDGKEADEEYLNIFEDEPTPKRVRIDAEGFKVPALPFNSRLRAAGREIMSGSELSPVSSSALSPSFPSTSTQITSDTATIHSQNSTSTEPSSEDSTQNIPEPDNLFTVDHFEDGVMITDDSGFDSATGPYLGALDLQQQERVIQSIEQSLERERTLTAGTIRPPLSEHEKQRRSDNNLCLYCGWPGHNDQNCGAALGAKKFKRKLKERERQTSLLGDVPPSVRSTPFSQQSTLGDGGSTPGYANSSTFGDDYSSTMADDDIDMNLLSLPGTPATPKKMPPRSETPSSVTSEGRRPGRPKGSKNKKAPEATAAEVVMENQLTDDVSYALNEAADESDRAFLVPTDAAAARTSTSLLLSQLRDTPTSRTATPLPQSQEAIDLTQEISAATSAISAATAALLGKSAPNPTIPLTAIPPGGVPVPSTLGNTGIISLSPTLSATEFDDDPEVSSCLLTSSEAQLKEQIWVAENAEWLRKDHYKRIQKELREAQMIAEGRDPEEEKKRKKTRNRLGAAPYMEAVRKRRQERLSQTPAGEEVDEEELARVNAAEATFEMVNARAKTAFSRRFNQEAMQGIWEGLASPSSLSSSQQHSLSPSPAKKTRQARQRSRISSTSTQRSSDHETTFQPPDPDGPLGPGMGRTIQSLAASKREAKRWDGLRKRKEEMGLPQKVSIPRAMRPGANRWGAVQRGSQEDGEGEESESPEQEQELEREAVVEDPLQTLRRVNAIEQAKRRAPARPKPQPRRKQATRAGDPATGEEGGGERMDTDSPLSSSVQSALPPEEAIGEVEGAAGEDDGEGEAMDSDENMSSDEDDDDDDELDEEDADDLDDALAGRVKRRYSSGESDEE